MRRQCEAGRPSGVRARIDPLLGTSRWEESSLASSEEVKTLRRGPRPGSASRGQSNLQLDRSAPPIPLLPDACQARRAGSDVRLQVEPVRDEIPRGLPCAFDLVEAQAEGLCNGDERSACHARVKDREHLIITPQVKPFLSIELKRACGDACCGKYSALTSLAKIPAASRESPQHGLILYRRLPPRGVGEDREGRHLRFGEDDSRMHEDHEPVAGAKLMVMLIVERGWVQYAAAVF